MIPFRIESKPAFWVAGKKTWIGGQNNEEFGQFWVRCREEGVFHLFESLTRFEPGAVTHGTTLGISQVENDPAKREFFYMIAVETTTVELPAGLEAYQVPEALWAVFECHGKVPESIVKAEIFAFNTWLPESGYLHALAPELEVYPPAQVTRYCEFWLPVIPKDSPPGPALGQSSALPK